MVHFLYYYSNLRSLSIIVTVVLLLEITILEFSDEISKNNSSSPSIASSSIISTVTQTSEMDSENVRVSPVTAV